MCIQRIIDCELYMAPVILIRVKQHLFVFLTKRALQDNLGVIVEKKLIAMGVCAGKNDAGMGMHCQKMLVMIH